LCIHLSGEGGKDASLNGDPLPLLLGSALFERSCCLPIWVEREKLLEPVHAGLVVSRQSIITPRKLRGGLAWVRGCLKSSVLESLALLPCSPRSFFLTSMSLWKKLPNHICAMWSFAREQVSKTFCVLMAASRMLALCRPQGASVVLLLLSPFSEKPDRKRSLGMVFAG
jgi:hypothetical protein